MCKTYDYIIVGAGSSGCVLASRLSEDPQTRVLLIESGPSDANPMITVPMGMGKLNVPGSRYNWEYTASIGEKRPDEKWIKGRTLGGSSAVNGMVYVRGMPRDYDNWAANGCPGWDWDEIGRCFVEIENHELGAAKWRGEGGPLRLEVAKLKDPICSAILEAAAEVGYPTVEDINDIDALHKGCFGPQPRNIWKGRRYSAAKAFLHPVRHRPNLNVVTDTDVLRVTFDGRRATGVCQSHKGIESSVSAAEVILSAGAINSPCLLQHSGIGPADLLHEIGIKPYSRPAQRGP